MSFPTSMYSTCAEISALLESYRVRRAARFSAVAAVRRLPFRSWSRIPQPRTTARFIFTTMVTICLAMRSWHRWGGGGAAGGGRGRAGGGPAGRGGGGAGGGGGAAGAGGGL